MSQVVASTILQKETIVVEVPMQLDNPQEQGGSTPAKPSPDQPPPPPPLPPVSMLRRLPAPQANDAVARQAAPEGEKPSELDVEANNPDKTGLPLNDDVATDHSGSEDQLCVCAPAQKVPRPPNSFILYRSRMHAHIALEHPGLSNPQISQVLGDRWAKESAEVKAQWKTLAIEESKRHSQQYPGYKYQPRRRGSKIAGHQHEEEAGRCGKCHGRYHKNPQTPSLPPPLAKSTVDTQAKSLPTPTSSVSDESYRSRPESLATMKARNSRPAEDADLVSPDVKRRRLTDAVETRAITPIRVSAYNRRQPGQSARTTPTTGPYSATHSIDSPLPHMGGVPRSHSGTMPPPPPPRSYGSSGWPNHGYPYAGRSGIVDESLRLPPLQTALPPPHSPAREGDARYVYTPIHSGVMPPSSRDSDMSAQETIMSLHYSRKLAILSKICPPLPRPSQAEGSGVKSRGPIIAVEGANDALLQEVGRSVEKALLVAPEDIALEIWTNTFPSDVQIQEDLGSGKEPSTAELLNAIPSIFQHTMSWHREAKKMSQHVQGGQDKATLASAQSQAGEGYHNELRQPSEGTGKSSTPVALIKGGFSLTVSDKFACCTSHGLTNYEPLDHWQWMATLWRGIVGPDLVVYVKTATEEESKAKNVEHQEKYGAIVVRLAPNKGLDEASERRLAFEVIEWMRSGWIRDGRPRSS